MRLTEKLAALRKKNCLTQSALAEKMDLSRQAVSRWESGETAPSMDNLRRLSSLYDVPLDCLLNDDAELPGPEIAVAVMEKPESEKRNRQRAILIGVVTIFVLLAFFVGHMMGLKKKEQVPNKTILPINSLPVDTLDGENFEESVDLIDW